MLNEEDKNDTAKWLDSSKAPDGKDINRTQEILCHYIKFVLNIEVTKSALSNTLKKMDYTLWRPRPTHHKGSEEEKAA